MKKIFQVSLLLFIGLSFLSCSGFSDKAFNNIFGYGKPPVISPDAYRLFLALNEKNPKIKTFKGTGRMNLSKKNGEILSADIAWVAEDSNKIYLAVRDILGQPIAGLATDGEYAYFSLYAEKTFYKKHSDNASLERFISIPIKIRDVILLLSGRVPVCDFDTASTVYDKGPVLVLKKKGTDVVEKIYFDNENNNVLQIDMLNSGDVVYRVVIDGVKYVKEYNIFSKLVISNDGGDYFKLDVNRFWADEPVSPSVFVLRPPE